MSTTKMVTIRIGDQEQVLTPADALNLAYRISAQAIEALGPGDGKETEPLAGDFYIDRPKVAVRVEPDDDGSRSVALVARGKSRPNVWLWFDEAGAKEIAATILNLTGKTGRAN